MSYYHYLLFGKVTSQTHIIKYRISSSHSKSSEGRGHLRAHKQLQTDSFAARRKIIGKAQESKIKLLEAVERIAWSLGFEYLL